MRIAWVLGLSTAITSAAQAQAQRAQQPTVINAEEIRDMLGDRYPRDLLLLGLGGIVRVQVTVTQAGTVSHVAIANGSGLPSLDEAARTVAWQIRFPPRSDSGIVTLPLAFTSNRSARTTVDVLPRIVNGVEVEDSARRRAGNTARQKRLQANVLVSVVADAAGNVSRIDVAQTSCIKEFDNAALASARLLRFNAVDSDREPRPTIVSFVVRPDSVRVYFAGEARDTASSPPNTQGVRTPPRLTNAPAVTRAMQQNYPTHLRDQGIGGTVTVFLLLNEKGEVERRMIRTPSESCALDLAALETIKGAKFEVAKVDGKPTTVWIQIPLIFRAQ
jgi:TonB family protein